jgi:hypothetical protein
LRGQVTNGRPTVHKDMSLISLIPKWGGTAKSMSVTVEEEKAGSVCRKSVI